MCKRVKGHAHAQDYLLNTEHDGLGYDLSYKLTLVVLFTDVFPFSFTFEELVLISNLSTGICDYRNRTLQLLYFRKRV